MSLINFLKQPPTIYSIIWCLYYLQGILYPEGNGISQVVLALFFLISIVYAIKANTEFVFSPFMKSVNALAILFAIYGIFRVLGIEFDSGTTWIYKNDATTFFKEYELSILPIYSFYYFTKKKIVDEDWFFHMAFLFIIVACLRFRKEEADRLLTARNDGVTNNTGYMFLSLLPCCVFLRKKTLLQFLYLSVVVYFILQGMKRGAILVAAISLLFLLPGMIKTVNNKRKFVVYLLTFIVLVGGFYYVTNIMMANDYFMLRVQQTLDGDSSNRADIYNNCWQFYIHQTDIIALSIGNGADGTLKYLGEYAHNDWLEILINHGVIGVLIYTMYWINGVKLYLHNRKCTPDYINLLFFLVIFSCFTKSFFSMSINSTALYATSVLGYVIAQKEMISDSQGSIQ